MVIIVAAVAAMKSPSKEGPCLVLCESLLAPSSAWHRVQAGFNIRYGQLVPEATVPWEKQGALPMRGQPGGAKELENPHLG